MQTTIVGNLLFNGPRAGINHDDGFGGGNNISDNALFNWCRDSGDRETRTSIDTMQHATLLPLVLIPRVLAVDRWPLQQCAAPTQVAPCRTLVASALSLPAGWDRQLYMVNQPDDDGSPSPYPQFTTIERNLMIANYNSQEAVVSTHDTGHSASISGTGSCSALLQDNDDGSGYFHTKENVLVYGRYGQKADMAGHDNWHVGVSLCGLAILLLPAFAALNACQGLL